MLYMRPKAKLCILQSINMIECRKGKLICYWMNKEKFSSSIWVLIWTFGEITKFKWIEIRGNFYKGCMPS